MSVFELYFKPGLEHIADFKGCEHILFILAERSRDGHFTGIGI